jgi:hypothetical protein
VPATPCFSFLIRSKKCGSQGNISCTPFLPMAMINSLHTLD